MSANMVDRELPIKFGWMLAVVSEKPELTDDGRSDRRTD